MNNLQSNNTNTSAGTLLVSGVPSRLKADTTPLQRWCIKQKGKKRLTASTKKQIDTIAARSKDEQEKINKKISLGMTGYKRTASNKHSIRKGMRNNKNAVGHSITEKWLEASAKGREEYWRKVKAGEIIRKQRGKKRVIMTYTEEQISKFRKFDEDTLLKRLAANKKRNAANRKREKIKAAKLKEINTKPKTAAKSAVALPKREVLPPLDTLIEEKPVAVKSKEEIAKEEYEQRLKKHYGY